MKATQNNILLKLQIVNYFQNKLVTDIIDSFRKEVSYSEVNKIFNTVLNVEIFLK